MDAMLKIHTEIPKIVTPEIPGVQCKNPKCDARIGIEGALANLGKSFKLKCPACGEVGTYRKSEMKSLQVERKS